MIYLVGAGPGDANLLTLRADELLSRAEVIVHDALVSDDILARGNPNARRIFVGKRSRVGTPFETSPAARTMTTRTAPASTQSEINALLASLAPEHETIVRLKGGDPFVFGRGGEEALYLAERDIPFEVIPGISSAIAAPGYAGIPVTHRGLSEAVTIITGHRDADHDSFAPDYDALVRLQGTIVFLMSAGRLAEISRNLVQFGKDPKTPAAVIQWGTLPHQKSVIGSLDEIAARAEEENIASPAVFVIGAVVSLADALNWYRKKPLFGRRIVVTRSTSDDSRLAAMLRAEGAVVIESPAITLHRIEPSPLETAFDRIRDYTDLILTSSFAVTILAERLEAMKIDARIFSGIRVAVVGASTAEELFHRTGLRADIVPERATSEGLRDALGEVGTRKFLWPCAVKHRRILPDFLGDRLHALPIYESRPTDTAISIEGADAIVLASAASARHFLDEHASVLRLDVANIPLVAIGPITGAELEHAGLSPRYAAAATREGLVEAVISLFR